MAQELQLKHLCEATQSMMQVRTWSPSNSVVLWACCMKQPLIVLLSALCTGPKRWLEHTC
jgi:hypothetical protein